MCHVMWRVFGFVCMKFSLLVLVYRVSAAFCIQYWPPLLQTSSNLNVPLAQLFSWLLLYVAVAVAVSTAVAEVVAVTVAVGVAVALAAVLWRSLGP